MTLEGVMALVVIRAILAHPEKFSSAVVQATKEFDVYWNNPKEEITRSGEEYWSQPDPAPRFPRHYIPWQNVKDILPEDFSERLKSLDSPESL